MTKVNKEIVDTKDEALENATSEGLQEEVNSAQYIAFVSNIKKQILQKTEHLKGCLNQNKSAADNRIIRLLADINDDNIDIIVKSDIESFISHSNSVMGLHKDNSKIINNFKNSEDYEEIEGEIKGDYIVLSKEAKDLING